MRSYRFFQLDVFTDKPFFGNPLAVFPEAGDVTDAEMQNIAREMNLSETVFVLPATAPGALRRLRIFTPTSELPLAGHPVVGAWNLLARLGVLPEVDEDFTGRKQIMHELNIGVLPVEIDLEWGVPQKVVMTQGKFVPGDIITGDAFIADLATGLGIERSDIRADLPVQVMETGVRALAVPVNSLAVMGKMKINSSLLAERYLGVGAIGVYAFTTETLDGAPSAAHARFFAPTMGIPEDAATGSAAGALSAYLVHHGVVSKLDNDGIIRFTIEQGDFMKRPSRIFAEIDGRVGDVGGVKVGGNSVILIQGELML